MEPEQIKNNPLFRGMSGSDIENALRELNASERSYRKGSVILHAGSATEKMGLVLAGSVPIESNDIWGNRTILSHVETGPIFAEDVDDYSWF